MLKQIAAALSLGAGLLALMLAQIFYRLIPLSGGFSQRGLWMLGISALLIGLALVLIPKNLKKILQLLCASAILAWVSLTILVYYQQDALLFSPRDFRVSRRSQIAAEYPTSQEMQLETGEGLLLQGWFIPPSNDSMRAPLVLVFPGQGGEASRYLDLSQQIPEYSWAFFNYRGYGLSQGQPSESALLQDALVIFDHFSAHPKVDPDSIFALGGSLGTGVATYLASQRMVRGVALFSPYDQIGGGVAQDLMPLVPTRLLLRNGFAMQEFAAQAQAPVLAIMGENDQVIPPRRSQLLLKHWAQPVETLTIPGGDHYTIYDTAISWDAIRDFFFQLLNQSSEVLPH